MVYKPLILVTAEEANQLGIITEMPVLITSPGFTRNYSREVLALNINYPPKGQYLYSQNGIFAFSELKTALDYESIGYYGDVPFSGFIAVAEVIGNYTVEPIGGFADKCIKSEKMRILGIKVFAEESDISEGYIEEVAMGNKSTLGILSKDKKSIFGDRSALRYSFFINQAGEAIFSMLIPDMSHYLKGGD